jgi:hypothetical protein
MQVFQIQRFGAGFSLDLRSSITTCFLNSRWGWHSFLCIGNGALLKREMKNITEPSDFGPRSLG